MRNFWLIVLSFLPLFPAIGQVRITEFMASNASTLADEDGDDSDWIEIQNTSAAPVSLLNWSLTDKAGNPTEWLFPATNLPPNSFMIIFASGKNRAIDGQELHTNFKLSTDGEYLALVRSDGAVMTEFAPQFPPQFPDVSYGTGMQPTWTALVASNAPLRYEIPAGPADDSTWTQFSFPDGSWATGINGIGYDTGVPDPLETSFAVNVLNTAPYAFWRLNETNGPNAANVGSSGLTAQGGYIGSFT